MTELVTILLAKEMNKSRVTVNMQITPSFNKFILGISPNEELLNDIFISTTFIWQFSSI